MGALTDQVDIIKRLLREYAAIKPSLGDIEVELVFDDERGHNELMQCGWIGMRRIHGSVVHIGVRGDKMWAQHDGTNDHVAQRLMAEGCPPGAHRAGLPLPPTSAR